MTKKNNGCWKIVNCYFLKSLTISVTLNHMDIIGPNYLAKFEDWDE